MASEATNVGNAERIGSAIAGTALVLRAAVRPSLPRLVMAVGGAALLQRAATGHCMLYQKLGIGTAPRPDAHSRDAAGRDRVLEASEESFPASDPPAWTPVAGAGADR